MATSIKHEVGWNQFWEMVRGDLNDPTARMETLQADVSMHIISLCQSLRKGSSEEKARCVLQNAQNMEDDLQRNIVEYLLYKRDTLADTFRLQNRKGKKRPPQISMDSNEEVVLVTLARKLRIEI